MGQISGEVFFDFGVQCHAGHVIKVGLFLEESPNQHTNKNGAEKAQRDNSVMLDATKMSEDVLDHKISGLQLRLPYLS